MFKTIAAPIAAIRTRRANKRYEAMIAASQAHLASIPVAHGYVRVYA